MSFSKDALERYSRQILVRNFGGGAQAKLQSAHIAVVGAGGVGAPLLLYLAGAGVGKITLYEDDEIALSNLHRQILYHTQSVGQSKAEAARIALHSLNAEVEIALAGRFDTPSNPKADLIIDGTDHLETRQHINQIAASWKTPLLAASLAQWEGQIAHFDPSRSPGCYHCLYPEGSDASAIPTCSEAGVIGPVAGVIGTLTALEALKIITGIEPLAPAEMLLFDGLYLETRILKITPRTDCPICDGA